MTNSLAELAATIEAEILLTAAHGSGPPLPDAAGPLEDEAGVAVMDCAWQVDVIVTKTAARVEKEGYIVN